MQKRPYPVPQPKGFLRVEPGKSLMLDCVRVEYEVEVVTIDPGPPLPTSTCRPSNLTQEGIVIEEHHSLEEMIRPLLIKEDYLKELVKGPANQEISVEPFQSSLSSRIFYEPKHTHQRASQLIKTSKITSSKGPKQQTDTTKCEATKNQQKARQGPAPRQRKRRQGPKLKLAHFMDPGGEVQEAKTGGIQQQEPPLPRRDKKRNKIEKKLV